MKTLFLDIDGVLNSEDSKIVLQNLLIEKQHKSVDHFGIIFDERCVNWLKYIVIKTGCKIVISSTWKDSGLEIIKLMWKMRDLPGEVIDCTPNEYSLELMDLYSEDAFRGYEIQEWINTYNPDNYCIVDDNDDMLKHQNFVKIDPEYGLNRKTAFAIISILNK